jgi:hypothetical protein
MCEPPHAATEGVYKLGREGDSGASTRQKDHRNILCVRVCVREGGRGGKSTRRQESDQVGGGAVMVMAREWWHMQQRGNDVKSDAVAVPNALNRYTPPR